MTDNIDALISDLQDLEPLAEHASEPLSAYLLGLIDRSKLLNTRATNPASAADVVERAAEAIRDVKCGLNYDYANFCRDAAKAALSTLPEAGWLDALEWFGKQRNLELYFYGPTYCDDDDQAQEWRIAKVSGSINDREWDTVGRGATPLEAIASARAALSPLDKEGSK